MTNSNDSSNCTNDDDCITFFNQLMDSFQRANPQVDKKKGLHLPPKVLLTSSYEEKEACFRQALEELSSIKAEDSLNAEETKSFADFFKNLYGGEGFRHRYAVICEVMYTKLGASEKLDCGVPYEIRSLSNNIEYIYAYMADNPDYSGVVGRVLKLNDHIELEVTRMGYLKEQNVAILDMKKTLEDSLSESEYSGAAFLDSLA